MNNSRECLVTIKNCKNISDAVFSIKTNCLNIKFAPNGTGKSSIADGLIYAITKEEALGKRIVPFKFRNESDCDPFECSGMDEFETVRVFNEEYVNNVVFVDSGLFSLGFDVFIKTPEYEETVKAIKESFKEIDESLREENMGSFRRSIDGVYEGITGGKGLSASNSLKATSHACRGLEKGNLKEKIPEGCECFSRYIASERLQKWSKWHIDGESLLNAEDTFCPFCGNDIHDSVDLIAKTSRLYSSNTVKHLNEFLGGIAVGNKYFASATQIKVEEIVNASESITQSQKDYLAIIATQAHRIIEVLNQGEKLASFFELASLGSDIKDRINNCIIDIELVDHFASETTKDAIERYNCSIANLLEKSSELLGIIQAQKQRLANSLKGYTGYINEFFASAGYPYTIRIEAEREEECRVVLIHESAYEVNDSRISLSYGERNALSLVFFAYSVNRENPDLIILDDPITSFDGRKRFAILDMLFLKKREKGQEGWPPPTSLKNRTVLLLTHEYGVVFDIEHTLKERFQPLAKTFFLNMEEGKLKETLLERNDMKLAGELYKELAKSSDSILVKLIYARKYLELTNCKECSWDILSSLFHHRLIPTLSDKTTNLTLEQMADGIEDINRIIDGVFNYGAVIADISNPSRMLQEFDQRKCGYEKMQIARVATDDDGKNLVQKKALDETVHVDNGYLWQLDPRRFEMIPAPIVESYRELILDMIKKEERSGKS